MLLVLRLALPSIVAAVIEARLAAALDATVAIDDVDLRLFAGEVTLHGLEVAPLGPASASAARVHTLVVGWRWFDLLEGGMPLDLVADGVALTLDLQARPPGHDLRRAPRSAEAQEPAGDVASDGLGPLRSLVVRDGHLEVLVTPEEAPILTLHIVHAALAEGAWHARGEAMTTRAQLLARAGEGGVLALTGACSPLRPRDAWTLEFALADLDLRPLNPLLERVLEMDAEGGALSLTGDLTASRGRLRGHVLPRFDALVLLDLEERVRHPMAEAIFSSMLATADLPIEIDRPAAMPRGGLALRLDAALRTDAMELLQRLILGGFARRLNTLVGHDATIGGLELDFPRGLLAFTDVTLRKTGGTADEPFLHVPRLAVRVEPSVVDPAIETFKAIALHRPRLVYIVGRSEAESQRSIDPGWQEKLSMLPYPTDHLEILGGEIEFRDETTRPPSRFVLAGLDLAIDDLARARRRPGARGATLKARALIAGESPLELEAAFSPGEGALDGELRLSLAPMELTALNGLLRSFLGVDVSAGTFGLEAELDARPGRLTGVITPSLADVTVLGVDEDVVGRPLRELLLELRLGRLDGVRVPLDVRGEDELLEKIPRALLSAIRDASAPNLARPGG